MAVRFNSKQQKLAATWRKYDALFTRKGGNMFVEESATKLKDETITKAYTSVLRANTELTEFKTKFVPHIPPKWSYLRHTYPKPYHGVVDLMKKQHDEQLKVREAAIDREISDLEANYPKVEKKLDDLLAGADLVLEEREVGSKPLPGTPSLANQLRPLVETLNSLHKESFQRLEVIQDNFKALDNFIQDMDKITVNDVLEDVPGFKEYVKKSYFLDRFDTDIPDAEYEAHEKAKAEGAHGHGHH
jgi:hypothetical protein